MHEPKNAVPATSSTQEAADVDVSQKQAPGELTRLRKRVLELEASQARGSLAESSIRDRLQDFAEAMGGWFWETDADHRFTYFSPSVYDITGVAAEWHYGKRREDFGIPDSVAPEVWQAHLEALQRREPFSNFLFQRRATDGVKWMRTSGRPVFDDQGAFLGYRSSASVITAEVEAQQRNDGLIRAIENLDEMFVLWGPDDRLVVCNQQFRDINARVIDSVQPGVLFETHIRTAMVAGAYPSAVGAEEAWI